MRTFMVMLAMLILPVAAAARGTSAPAPDAAASTQPDGKGKNGAVQHGAQPNPEEVRPGNRDGDAPSAAAGDVVRDPVQRRIFGLPVSAALVVAGVLVALLVIGGVVIPASRRRERARGGGTYGR